MLLTAQSRSPSVTHNLVSTDSIKAPQSYTAAITILTSRTLLITVFASVGSHAYAASALLSIKVLMKMAESLNEHALDPTIWSKLPRDVLHDIVEHSDLPTQVNWSCTSRAFFLNATRKIWDSLHLRSSDITAYVLIVFGHRFTDRADGIVHFLLENAYRRHDHWQQHQLTATLPSSHVKALGIDNQGFDDQHPICVRVDMDLVLPTLLQRLPKLQSFNYVGPLSTKNLAAIVQVNSLRVLQVRNGSDVLKVPTAPTPNNAMPWLDVSLDWSVLASLKGLRELEIGRLTHYEGSGLAKGVVSLSLRKLHLSCWGWEYENTRPSRSMSSTAHTSALVMFLEALTTLDLGGGQSSRGLPSSLQHLVLIDKFHTRIPSLHQLIATAVLPCENLETLSTTISVNGRCHDSISKMGLPAYHKIVGVRSWQQLSCDDGMKIVYQYQSPSGETLQTNAYPKPLRNIFKTLDRVIAITDGSGHYRMSMKFVLGRQFRSDEILIYPCEAEHGSSAAEQGPQAHDRSMLDLAIQFIHLSHDETMRAHLLRFWGYWPEQG